jgi:hypothetical protein
MRHDYSVIDYRADLRMESRPSWLAPDSRLIYPVNRNVHSIEIILRVN